MMYLSSRKSIFPRINLCDTESAWEETMPTLLGNREILHQENRKHESRGLVRINGRIEPGHETASQAKSKEVSYYFHH